jgi:hypothetical protein
VLTFFIKKEMISATDAKYPTHSVIVIPNIISLII